MKRFISATLIFLSQATFGTAEIYHLKMPSAALVDSNRIIVATPTTYNESQVYPFIIMLHGWSGDETQWEDDADLQFLADEHNLLLILPDGGYDGWWLNTDLLPGRNYDTHIHKEVKEWIILYFNGSSNPADHGVMGLSMGGYGAFMQVFRHPGDYAAASALSGVMDLLPRTKKWGLKLSLGEYPQHKTNWELHNPVMVVDSLDPEQVPPLQLICGRDDFVFGENVEIVTKLKAGGFSVEFLEEEGKHSHDFWKAHVNTSIAFLVSHMGDH